MYLYDKAIVEAFEFWTKDNITIVGPENAFQQYAEENKDQLTLPLAVLNRQPWKLKETSKSTKTFDGAKIVTETNKTIKLLAIPIELHYQLDLYAKTLTQCDNMVREFIFKIINVPKITLDIPYNRDIHLTHHFNLKLGDTVENNSDIVEHINRGQYYRQTLDIYVEDAYLWNVVEKDNVKLHCADSDLLVVDETTGKIYQEN